MKCRRRVGQGALLIAGIKAIFLKRIIKYKNRAPWILTACIYSNECQIIRIKKKKSFSCLLFTV
jgi:hypothetical protein